MTTFQAVSVAFIAGLMAGASIGVFAIALMQSIHRGDRSSEGG